MLDRIPTKEELISVMGVEKFKTFNDITSFIEEKYNVDAIWDNGGKAGLYELKYRKSGRTLCALYLRELGLHILIIYGKAEREKFESSKKEFSQCIIDIYDNTKQYHDGKWLFIDLINDEFIGDIKRLLLIKKKPNKK